MPITKVRLIVVTFDGEGGDCGDARDTQGILVVTESVVLQLFVKWFEHVLVYICLCVFYFTLLKMKRR